MITSTVKNGCQIAAAAGAVIGTLVGTQQETEGESSIR